MNRIMLDLETLGKTPGSIIATIGAVRFGGGCILDRFYERVDVVSCQELGFTMDVSTVLWWLKQESAARMELTSACATPLTVALNNFTTWLHKKEDEEIEVWGCGVDFDNALLSAAYAKMGLRVPWPFWANRCYRTVKAMVPQVKIERAGTHHNALADAESQANHLMEIEIYLLD